MPTSMVMARRSARGKPVNPAAKAPNPKASRFCSTTNPTMRSAVARNTSTLLPKATPTNNNNTSRVI